jgi:phenylpropionate dioxygenase-like ring-hydroxylating dioxygenase large terminal subunit
MLEKSLPGEYHRSPEIFAKERERIFSREWVCAGRADELQRGKARD